jgi:hypothetical protein
MVLSFTIAAGPRQRSHSRVRVPRDSWPYFTFPDSRLPQPGGPGSRICIPREGWHGYNPKLWVPFSSSPTPRRATVEVFDPASTQVNSSPNNNDKSFYIGTSPLQDDSSAWSSETLAMWTVCGLFKRRWNKEPAKCLAYNIQAAEDNTWVYERESDRRLEKAIYRMRSIMACKR